MATIIIEYRHNRDSRTWLRSAMDWKVEDLMFMNNLFGYEKYRTRVV